MKGLLLLVESSNGSISFRLSGKGDEAKSPAAAGLAVFHDDLKILT